MTKKVNYFIAVHYFSKVLKNARKKNTACLDCGKEMSTVKSCYQIKMQAKIMKSQKYNSVQFT
jgi:hypothetical protein